MKKVPLTLAIVALALLGACVPDDIYWLPDNRHIIAMRGQPVVIDTQEGTVTPLELPGLKDGEDAYFIATPDLRRIALFGDEGVVLYEKSKEKYARKRTLTGAEFMYGKLWSPSGDRLLFGRDVDNHSVTVRLWDARSGRGRDIATYADSERDVIVKGYWFDEDRFAVIVMREPQGEAAANQLYTTTGECILHDLSTETTRTLAANLRFHSDLAILDSAAADPDGGRLLIADANTILAVDVDSGQARRLYPCRPLEAEWPAYFVAVAGFRYNSGLGRLAFTGMERADGGANLYECDLFETEELPLNPFPWIEGGRRDVRAVRARPLTHFRDHAAFYPSWSPHGDKLAYFVNTKDFPGIVVQRGERWQLVIADNQNEKLRLIEDLNARRDRLFEVRDEVDRANDWAEWAVKIINDSLGEDDRDKRK